MEFEGKVQVCLKLIILIIRCSFFDLFIVFIHNSNSGCALHLFYTPRSTPILRGSGMNGVLLPEVKKKVRFLVIARKQAAPLC